MLINSSRRAMAPAVNYPMHANQAWFISNAMTQHAYTAWLIEAPDHARCIKGTSTLVYRLLAALTSVMTLSATSVSCAKSIVRMSACSYLTTQKGSSAHNKAIGIGLTCKHTLTGGWDPNKSQRRRRRRRHSIACIRQAHVQVNRSIASAVQ